MPGCRRVFGKKLMHTTATGLRITAPSAPTSVVATAGDANASIAFTVPSSNGNSPILDYIVTSSPSNITQTGTTSPIVISGLTIGTSYTFTVKARNVTGYGAASSPTGSTPTRRQIGITLSSNTYDYNLFANKGGTYIAGFSDVILTINTGIQLRGSSSGTPAFDTGTGWTTGDTLKIINSGAIAGAGGIGGIGGNFANPGNGSGGGGSPGGTGGTGGTGIALHFNLSIYNGTGFVYAGSGGGGGGGGDNGYANGYKGVNGSVGGTLGAAGGTGGSGSNGSGTAGYANGTGGEGAKGEWWSFQGIGLGPSTTGLGGVGGSVGYYMQKNGFTLTWLSGAANVFGNWS